MHLNCLVKPEGLYPLQLWTKRNAEGYRCRLQFCPDGIELLREWCDDRGQAHFAERLGTYPHVLFQDALRAMEIEWLRLTQ